MSAILADEIMMVVFAEKRAHDPQHNAMPPAGGQELHNPHIWMIHASLV
jgi:hypothetical protein